MSYTQFETLSQDLKRHSLLFDGVNDFLDLGAVADLQFERTDSFSFEFWAKPLSVAIGRFYSARSSAGDTPGIEVLWVGGEVQFLLNADNAPVDRAYVETTATPQPGIWHHIVCTYDGSSAVSGMKIYINNVSDTLTTLSDTLSATIVDTGDVKIGTNRAETQFFNGYISRVTIFDKELSANEVSQLFNRKNVLNLDTMSATGDQLHRYEMGDGATSLTISDEVGSDDGTMTGMAGSAISNDVP